MFRGHAYNFGLRNIPLEPEPGTVDKNNVFSFWGPRFEFTSQLHHAAHSLCDVPGILIPLLASMGTAQHGTQEDMQAKVLRFKILLKNDLSRIIQLFYIFSFIA